MKRYQVRMARGIVSMVCALALVVLVVLGGIYLLGGNDSSPADSSLNNNVPTRPVEELRTPGAGGTAAPTAKPTAKPAGQEGIVTIKAVGDIMMKDDQLNAAKQADGSYDFSEAFAEVKPLLSGGDLVFASLESVLNGKSNATYSGTEVMMNAPASILTTLKNIGVTTVVTANSHCLDGGVAGVENTISEIKAAGLDYVGTYTSQAEYDEPKVVTVNGIKIGMVAYTAETNNRYTQIPAEKQQYITRFINVQKLNKIENDIKALKNAGAEYIIAYAHWGELYKDAPTAQQRDVAQLMLDNGVDLILGSHPHAVQSITYKDITLSGKTKKVAVAYSLGNFYADQASTGNVKTKTGYVLNLTIKKNEDGTIGITDNSCVPTYLYQHQENNATQYKILPLGKYATASAAPEGMDTDTWQEMKDEWKRVDKIAHNGINFKKE